MYLKIVGEGHDAMAIMQSNVPRKKGDVLLATKKMETLPLRAPTVFAECSKDGVLVEKKEEKLVKENKMLKKTPRTKRKAAKKED